jgi:transcriptional regulator with XRE-family HTH domain
MKSPLKKITTQLKSIRKSRGFSTEAAARHLGVALSTWWKWESGQTTPSPMALRQLAEKFGPELDKLRPVWYERLKAV